MTTWFFVSYLRARAYVAIMLGAFAQWALASAECLDTATDAAADRRGICTEQFHPAYN